MLHAWLTMKFSFSVSNVNDKKINVKCPKEHHSRSAAVEGIMSHDTRKCRVKKHGSGSEIRRRTVQREMRPIR